MKKYLHVYFGYTTDYYQFIRKQISKNYDHAYICNRYSDNIKNSSWIIRRIYRFYIHHKNRRYSALIFRLFLVSSFIDTNLDYDLKKSCNVVFHLVGMEYEYFELGLVKYLKHRYKKAKVVFTFSDRIDRYYQWFENFNLSSLKESVDLLTTYNSIDAKKYGIIFLPSSFICNYDKIIPSNETLGVDIVFVGADKGRLKHLLDFAKLCRSYGVSYLFYLINIPVDSQIQMPGIVYSKHIIYEKVLSLEKGAKAILNILQSEVEGITLRECEAIGMNKIIVTNSSAIKSSTYYNENLHIDLNNFCKDIKKLQLFNITSTWNNLEKDSFSYYFSRLDSIINDL